MRKTISVLLLLCLVLMLFGCGQKTEENGAPVTRVSDYRFLPVVSHMSMFNAVYMLSDYTEELAAFHYLRYLGQDFTIPRLWAIWQSVTGEVH